MKWLFIIYPKIMKLTMNTAENIDQPVDINGIPTYFETGFDDYTYEQKLRITKAVELKYLDWDEMIDRKFQTMRDTFTEGGESDVRAFITNETLTLKYPEVTGTTLRFTAILGVQGKGLKHPRYYHQCIGKFNIQL